MKGLSDSLAGRAVFLDLEPLSLGEIEGEKHWLSSWLQNPGVMIPGKKGDPSHTLSERMYRGWMPEAQALPLELVPDFYTAYLRTYVERDASGFSAPRELQTFGSFVRLLAGLNAREITASAIARELGISGATVVRWLGTLSATFQFQSIPAYSGNPVKRVVGKSKGVLREIGLAVHLLRLSGPASVADAPGRGGLFEALVIGEIRKAASLLSVPPAMYHWRSAGGAEVDLLLEWNGVLYPMEIKLASNPARRDTSGLAAFWAAHPSVKIAPGLVVCAGDTPYPITPDCWAIPWNWTCASGV
jgi:hypothetical protein